MSKRKKRNNDNPADVVNLGGFDDSSELLNGASDEPVDISSEPIVGNPLDEPLLLPPTDQPTGENGERTKRRYTRRSKDAEVPLIDGEMLMLFTDLVVPTAIVAAHNMVSSKEKQMSPDDVMLTNKQEEKMKRFSEKAAERINLNISPVWGFALGMGAIYTGNYIKNKK